MLCARVERDAGGKVVIFCRCGSNQRIVLDVNSEVQSFNFKKFPGTRVLSGELSVRFCTI